MADTSCNFTLSSKIGVEAFLKVKKRMEVSTVVPQQIGFFGWIYRWLFGDVSFVSVSELSVSLNDLRQKLNDSMVILPRRHKESVRLASVNILDANETSIGVGIFVSKRRIISALRVFKYHYNFNQKKFNAKTEIFGLLHRPNNQEEKVKFCVIRYDESLDLAVLELVDSYSDASHCVALPAIGINIFSDNEEDDVDKLAVTSFTSALANQAPNAVDVSFCVLPAVMLKVSKRHLLYTSFLFSGDSGGAVLMAKDGSLRGLHQETVNQASDELRRGATNEEVVSSINSLINGFSSGFIGLRLDIEEVQNFITMEKS